MNEELGEIPDDMKSQWDIQFIAGGTIQVINMENEKKISIIAASTSRL